MLKRNNNMSINLKILSIFFLFLALGCTGSNNKTSNKNGNVDTNMNKSNLPNESKLTQDFDLKNLKASKWNIVGNSNFSKAAVDNQRLLIAPDSTKYIAFRDFSTNPKGQITVMYNKDAKQNWQVLGNTGFSTGQVDNVKMIVGTNGKLYVTYKDSGLNEKAVVMYYNSEAKQWQMLGGKPASAEKADSLSIAINPTNNRVYLAYSDYANGVNGFAKVVKFDGSSWINVGSKDYVLPNKVTDNSLAFDKQGKLYLAFSDKGFAMGRAAVMAYNSSSNSWDHMGSPGLSQGIAGAITLAVSPDNNLYLASNMQVDGIGVHILFYDKDIENWTSLGKTPVSDKYSFDVSLAISSDNKIYVGYRNSNDGGHADVVTLNNSQDWVPLGTSTHVSPGNVGSVAIAIDQDNIPVLAYSDLSAGGDGKATVLDYSIEKILEQLTSSKFNSSQQCVIISGTIYCKGKNQDGQLGVGDNIDRTKFTPIDVTNIPNIDRKFNAVALGLYSACAVSESGKVYCWGWNYFGQLGDGTNIDKNKPVAVYTSSLGNIKFTSISLGAKHACAIGNDGKTYCWGINTSGQLGDGTNANKTIPVAVNTSVTFNSISLGEDHACGIDTTGVVYCWGSNSGGALGIGSTLSSKNLPTAIKASTPPFNHISSGKAYTCGTITNGQVYCWGFNLFGQVGNGHISPYETKPVLLNTSNIGNVYFTNIFTGYAHTCAMSTTNKIYCWGVGATGQLGTGDLAIAAPLPTSLDTSSIGNNIQISSLSLSNVETCMITAPFNKIYCIGWVITPQVAPALKNFKSIASNKAHSCGIGNDNKVYCWGDNSAGQLGDGTNTNHSAPTLINTNGIGVDQFTSIYVGSFHSCAIVVNGNTYCWGANAKGQIGNGENKDSQTTPARVATDQHFISMSLGRQHSCAISASNYAYCWGLNDVGELGIGDYREPNMPFPIRTSLQFKMIAAGWGHTCAITLAGNQVFCWGSNYFYESGSGHPEGRDVVLWPFLVNGSSFNNEQLISISANGNLSHLTLVAGHTCVVTASGRVFCWGDNASKQLGNGTNQGGEFPIPIDTRYIGSVQFTKVLSGQYHNCGISNTNKIYCWGSDIDDWNIDQGTHEAYPTQVSINGNSEFKNFYIGGRHTCLNTVDDSSYCWGENGFGQALGALFFPVELP